MRFTTDSKIIEYPRHVGSLLLSMNRNVEFSFRRPQLEKFEKSENKRRPKSEGKKTLASICCKSTNQEDDAEETTGIRACDADIETRVSQGTNTNNIRVRTLSSAEVDQLIGRAKQNCMINCHVQKEDGAMNLVNLDKCDDDEN